MLASTLVSEWYLSFFHSHQRFLPFHIPWLSGLCCYESSTPYNESVVNALRVLLTPKLASMLRDQVPKDLLSKLNTNLESPKIIWNSSTRALVLKFMDKQRASQGPYGSYDLKDSHIFAYEALSKELFVGSAFKAIFAIVGLGNSKGEEERG
ncbi:hypothetical protein V6N13_103483 [Hibiscus sabdariffa]|uniref:Beta-lactamase-related domain-containing protein n=1 Tax=Hibiscus sabdariffa TaxID=183260 RepID=A0ABR2NGN9_9ROSI